MLNTRGQMEDINSGIGVKQTLIAREFDKFYSAKNGDGDNNLDMMADAIENLNTLISNDLRKEGKRKITLRVKQILVWYRTLESNPKSYVNTPDGTVFKQGVHHKANDVLTKYFTILKDEIENLGLLN
jgi:hypothetical protein